MIDPAAVNALLKRLYGAVQNENRSTIHAALTLFFAASLHGMRSAGVSDETIQNLEQLALNRMHVGVSPAKKPN